LGLNALPRWLDPATPLPVEAERAEAFAQRPKQAGNGFSLASRRTEIQNRIAEGIGAPPLTDSGITPAVASWVEKVTARQKNVRKVQKQRAKKEQN
jgi:hypothetical protein